MLPLITKFLLFSYFLIIISFHAHAQRCIPLANCKCDEDIDAGRAGPGCLSGTRWAYNPSTRQCVAFTYQGCGGNTNRYCSRAECERRCVV